MMIKETLKCSNISPRDSEIILSHVIKKSREYIFTHPEKELTMNEFSKFNSFLQRRKKGEPVAYLTGQKEFFGLDFFVDRNVLIPRPETELLVELAVNSILRAKNISPFQNVIDVGTGSGNIAISIAKTFPNYMLKKVNFYAADVSAKALLTAKKNAQRHRVREGIKFVQSDILGYFLKNITGLKGRTLITANLPYVAAIAYKKYFKNLQFEPKQALFSSKRGLAHYEKLLTQAKQLVNSGGSFSAELILEISPEQKTHIDKIARKIFPLIKLAFFRDLAGKTRIAELTNLTAN